MAPRRAQHVNVFQQAGRARYMHDHELNPDPAKLARALACIFAGSAVNSAVNSPTDDNMAKLVGSSVFLAVLLLLYERTAAQSSEAGGSAVTALYPGE